ncbi:hypothetical protein LTR84_003195 [Exophiala bonariae]|uniref:Uncharacterized protein n=1 Tax=Exophiala bonariae TaxID=1690606 RepID=A0AAV9N7Z6_9EURO|nr:hypothetical protein LTR84_003195 [Exophiala bonariae]
MDSRKQVNNTTSSLTATELEAIAGLIQLAQPRQAEASFEAGTESKPPVRTANTTAISAGTNSRQIVTSLEEHTGQIQTAMQSQVADNAQPGPQTWFHDLLSRAALKNFMRYGVRPMQLDAEGEGRLEAVLVVMQQRSSVQEAAWYLDDNNWDVQDAITQYLYDEAGRANDQTGAYQRALQATNSVTRHSFNQGLLQYRIREGGGLRRRYDFPNTDAFDVDNVDHLRALNHWRADMDRLRGPLPDVPRATRSDRGWTDSECRYLQNLYASKKDDFTVGKRPDMAKIMEEFNKVFVGRYLPGRLNPCSARTISSANAWLDRSWKRDEPGKRLNLQQRYETAMNILQHRKDEDDEYHQFTQ